MYKNEKGVDNTFCFTIGFYDADRKQNTLTHTRYYCSVNIHTHILTTLHNNIFILHIYYMYVFTYSTYTIKECNNTRLHYYRSTIIPLLLLLLVVGFYWRERINATLGKSPVPFLISLFTRKRMEQQNFIKCLSVNRVHIGITRRRLWLYCSIYNIST